MKKIIAFFIITTALCKITSAQIDTTNNIINPVVKNSSYYLEKKSNFNKGGALLGIMALGSFVATGISTNQSEGLAGLDALMFGAMVSLVCTVGSLFCFIGADKNKKKANLLLKEEHVKVSSKTSLNLYSAGIRINF